MSKPVTDIEAHIAPQAFEPRVAAGAKSRLEITAAVKNKKGEWVTPTLDKTHVTPLRNAVEAIHYQYTKAKGMGQPFDQEGAVLEVTKNGIYVQKEDKTWQNILDDKNIDLKTKKAILKTLSAITSVVGEMSETKKAIARKTEQKTKTDTESHASDLVKQQSRIGNVVIEVRVASKSGTLSDKLKALQQNIALEKAFSETYPEETKEELKRHLENLENSANTLANTIENIRNKVGSGEDATSEVESLPQMYREFCDALRVRHNDEAYLIQNGKMVAHTGRDTIFFNNEEIEEFLFLAKSFSVQARDELITANVNFEKFIELKKRSTNAFKQAVQQERTFNETLASLLDALENPSIAIRLQKHGVDSSQLQDYKTKLNELKQQSDAMLKSLEEAERQLGNGNIQKAMDDFCNRLGLRAQAYGQACEALVLPQTLCRGKLIRDEDMQNLFSLDLNPLVRQREALYDVIKATRDADVKNASNAPLFQVAGWEDPLSELVEAGVRIEQSLSYSVAAPHINRFHKSNLQFASALGVFVSKYQSILNRENFDQAMRSHGILDAEGAFIFNHYAEILEALQAWNVKFQDVADLVNQKKYQEAAEAYAHLMVKEYPKLCAVFRRANLAQDKLSDPRVRIAFLEFAHLAKIENPEHFLDELSQGRMTLFKEEYQSVLGDLGSLAVLPSELRELVQHTIENEFNLARKEWHEFETLTVNFSFKSLADKMRSNVRLANALKQHGWSSQDILTANLLYNRLGEIVRPLKEAEQAIAYEKDPRKRASLQAQLHALAEKALPMMQKIQTDLKKFGGLEKVNHLREAAEMVLKDRPTGSKDAMLVELEEYKTLPKQDPNIIAKYQTLLDQFSFYESLDKSTQFLTAGLKSRVHFLDKLCIDLGLSTSFEKHSIDQLLLQGPLKSDQAFFEKLKSKGWQRSDIQKFSKWYDAFMLEALPVLKAKSALEADPENIRLQEAYKKTSHERFKGLTRLVQGMKEFGGIEQLRAFQEAVSEHVTTLKDESTELVDEEGNLSRATDKARFDEIQLSLERLNQIDFPRKVFQTLHAVADAHSLRQTPMSWDTQYMKQLEGLSKIPLGQYGLTSKKVAQVIALYQNFQKALKKIAELSHKVDVNPLDAGKRSALINEMHKQIDVLNGLNSRYEELADDVLKVQDAINDLPLPEGRQPFNLSNALYQKQTFMFDIYERFGFVLESSP